MRKEETKTSAETLTNHKSKTRQEGNIARATSRNNKEKGASEQGRIAERKVKQGGPRHPSPRTGKMPRCRPAIGSRLFLRPVRPIWTRDQPNFPPPSAIPSMTVV